MNIKQYLYDIKQNVIAKNTPKLTVTENQKIIIVQNCTATPFEKLFPNHVVSNTLNSIDQKDYEKIEIFFGAPKKSLLSQMHSLKWLQLSSAGINGYDAKNLYSSDVTVTTAKGVYGLPISECVVGDVLFLMKSAISNATGKKYEVPPLSSRDFTGCTALICGLGDIGKNIAVRFKGMQCGKIIGLDKYITSDPSVDEIYVLDKLNEYINEADVIVSALPETNQTIGIFNNNTFNKMKKGAIFVNVGRGSAVDQNALLQSIKSGHIYGAALDATSPDPLPKNHPLRKCGRILITDHLACISSDNTKRLEKYYLLQSEKYIKGELI